MFERANRFNSSRINWGTAPLGQSVQDAGRVHTLLITCTDTCAGSCVADRFRNDQVLLFQTPASVVPAAWAAGRETATIVERAVAGGVKDVVVCGHSLCQSLVERLSGQLAPARRAVSVPPACQGQCEDFMQKTINRMQAAATLQDRVCEHVLAQLRNLETYPSVARGEVAVHGWVYLDQSGVFLSYDPGRQEFVPLTDHPAVSRGAVRPWPMWPTL